MLTPAMVFYALFSIAPIVIVGRLSLFKTNYITSEFVGLANYVRMFTEPVVGALIINSFLYAIPYIGAVTFLSVATSLLIIDMPKWIHNVMRFIYYIPVFAAGIIIATVWRWILHPQIGLANWLLGSIGIDSVMWLGYRYLSIAALCVMLASTSLGAGLVIYLAAMLSIPSTIFDSAKIYGATNFQIKIGIILPIISPTIFMMTLIGMIGAMQVWETIYMMRPIAAANNLMFDIFLTGFTFSQYGLAAAKTLVLMLLILSMSIIKRRIER